jgi:hypothetical protein
VGQRVWAFRESTPPKNQCNQHIFSKILEKKFLNKINGVYICYDNYVAVNRVKKEQDVTYCHILLFIFRRYFGAFYIKKLISLFIIERLLREDVVRKVVELLVVEPDHELRALEGDEADGLLVGEHIAGPALDEANLNEALQDAL